jgi:hypothetical protein
VLTINPENNFWKKLCVMDTPGKKVNNHLILGTKNACINKSSGDGKKKNKSTDSNL